KNPIPSQKRSRSCRIQGPLLPSPSSWHSEHTLDHQLQHLIRLKVGMKRKRINRYYAGMQMPLDASLAVREREREGYLTFDTQLNEDTSHGCADFSGNIWICFLTGMVLHT